ncbi:ROK family protein [Mucilaginibacter gossypii]|uniref:Glucokinase n=1 Tax=Mucilaginibacter gossypii TaxID=551996 RepID=A0A1G8ALH2_9SPHI|nr:ROK family protein [Mucilaginibacter gossypii]SDH21778.1 glucokinase [Mucilaginibacter gossypii]
MINNPVFSSGHILTADIGGSHITAGICDLQRALILPETMVRADVDSKAPAEAILSSWTAALKNAMNQHSALKPDGLSIAMPGPFDYLNGVSFITGLDKYEALYGRDIKAYLADKLQLAGSQIRFRNDAESTIAGEATAVAGRGYQRVMGVTLGTGFGSAVSENGITRDINLGSNPYKESVADDYFSTRWFKKRYRELTGRPLNDGVRELASLANSDLAVGKIFSEYAQNMAGFLSAHVAVHQPEVLIICGNIAKAGALFWPQLQEYLAPLEIKTAQLDEQAALIGAAALFKTNYNKII